MVNPRLRPIASAYGPRLAVLREYTGLLAAQVAALNRIVLPAGDYLQACIPVARDVATRTEADLAVVQHEVAVLVEQLTGPI